MPAKRETAELSSALYKAADRNARRHGLRAALFLFVALVAAVGSAVLLTRYTEARTEAIDPSHDFFGLASGASRWRPNARPT